jgi:hypothetical protein
MDGQRMKPALHRSAVFWLGVFVLGFLMWAWVSSYRTGTSLYRIVIIEETGVKPRAVYDEGMNVDSGKILFSGVSVAKPRAHVTVVHEPLSLVRHPPEAGDSAPVFKVRSYHDAEVTMATVQRSHAEVPVWAIVAGYLFPWGAVLVWRTRRWRRVLDAEV